MTQSAELSQAWSRLDAAQRNHLARLVSSWEMLADFCFADLVLYLRADTDQFVMVSHVRPSTFQTIYHSDLVGEVRSPEQRPLVADCFATGELSSGEVESSWLDARIRITCIPVRFEGRLVAVLARESVRTGRGSPGALEQNYAAIFDRFATMIADGTFPFTEEQVHLANAPRVGNGVVLIDRNRNVEYASPNATSALTRSGVDGVLLGVTLAAAGFESPAVRSAITTGQPGVDEVEHGEDTVVAVRVMPLIADGEVTGAVVLLRDVSDLRRRDLLLLSKDATIREIHHRVKNNLQTISSLLRLQGRRLEEPSAKSAVEEAVRRIRTIALVHDMLSRDSGDDVLFLSVLRPLVSMVTEGLVSADRPIDFVIDGDPGKLSATMATSLSVAVTELLQNIVEHAYPNSVDLSEQPAVVTISLLNDSTSLRLTISDNGIGMTDDQLNDEASSLGLGIVKSLIETELGGMIGFSRRSSAPVRPGTTVELVMPLAATLGDEAWRT